MSLPHPWQRLRESTHVTLHWVVDLPTWGRCKHSTQEVFIRVGLTQAQRRVTILHELEHLAAGPAVRGYADKDEAETRERAARWLLPLDVLADALVWSMDDRELADELWVDLTTIRVRLSTLTPVEDAYLNARIDAAERTFPA